MTSVVFFFLKKNASLKRLIKLFSAPSPRFDLNVCTRLGARVPPPYYRSLFSLSLLLCVLGYWFLKFSLYILFLLIHGSVFFFFSFSRFVCLFVCFLFCLLFICTIGSTLSTSCDD